MGSTSGSTLLMYKRRKCESGFVRSSSPPVDTELEEDHEDWPSSSPLQLHTPEKVDTTGSCERLVQVLKTTPDSKRTVAPLPAKRSRQLFLDLGQADFTHTTCRICGLVYARGLEIDEKLHKSFHRSQLKGIHYKGWSDERVAHHVSSLGDRVVYVLPSDPPGYLSKVQEVVKVMEQEMGLSPGWLWHKQDCKVYLFISASKKIVGCLVAERINAGFPIVPHGLKDPISADTHYLTPRVSGLGKKSEDQESASPKTRTELREDTKKPCKQLLWGGWKFTREVVNRKKTQNDNTQELARAIMCSKTGVPAVCGVRGIWVSRSERRKGIASHLLDAMRKTFCLGVALETSQCAFSQPSPDGEAFAARYCGTPAFLVYHSSFGSVGAQSDCM
ncbi:hypothetical protein KC19_3G228300 [Ceratodon purpureus]|uniref:Uncharacterized protein n=1 Tax=Ceratodon purpureus TaxID=3225 RepID=A0A8T0IPE7_CERPU|nr:hypothetical protein KC19_3G228300 [Ceratodon purpureus]KAG0584691.1 hypothetical protein KC19_3G228300 [Ceratodon purpureus]KAG0584693.1 hypothetical protein KC19_3G228300 [Ceratodon purpureus]